MMLKVEYIPVSLVYTAKCYWINKQLEPIFASTAWSINLTNYVLFKRSKDDDVESWVYTNELGLRS